MMEIFMMTTRCGEAVCIGAARDSWTRMWELGGPEHYATEGALIAAYQDSDEALQVLSSLHETFAPFGYSEIEPMFAGLDSAPLYFASDCRGLMESLLVTNEEMYGVFEPRGFPVVGAIPAMECMA